MSLRQRQVAEEFDVESARRAVLRYQPGANWVSLSRDPLERMTVGFGFDLSRSEASEMLAQVGLDPAAVRSGRVPISDAQMSELFDLELEDAIRSAHVRVPAFADLLPEQQWALLELILWLGPDGTEAVFDELEQLSLPLTPVPLEPAQWFDVRPEATSPRRANGGMPTSREPSSPVSAIRCRTTFESFGLVGELVSDDPDLLHAAHAMLPPGWREAEGEPTVQFGVWTDESTTFDRGRADRSRDREALLLRLGAMVRHHVATHARGFTFVHAGVVDAGGCGIVIPGRSYTGKSTLVAELVRLGATYVSDEYAVLDPSGLVHPFAKPLSIRTGRQDPLGQLVPAPQALVADQPVRAGLVVLTSYAPWAKWRPSAGSRAEGAFALLQNTVSARLRPGPALSATSRLAREAILLAGRRGEAAETARALLGTALLQAESSFRFLA